MNPVAAFPLFPSEGDPDAPISVPRQHESVLILPQLNRLPDLSEYNSQVLSGSTVDLQGLSLGDLRRLVRADVLDAAVEFTGTLVQQTVERPPPGPLIVTGHQPELFHPGVWAKNFAVAGIGRKNSGTALNLIIDNDTVSSTQIRVPVGTSAAPSIEWIPFDVARPQQPWEESRVLDSACFASFGERVRSQIREKWLYEPIIAEFWPAAVRLAGSSQRIGDCLAASRVAAERSMGLRNLEVPMSRVCSSLPFCWFASYMMAHLPRFHRIYNQAVCEYRQSHHLRSSTHPVPELDVQGEWMEAPFWIWRAGDVRRDRPFLRRVGTDVELRDRQGWSIRLPISSERSLEDGATVLDDLRRQGIRLRTRALTTTLFARLCLADLFVHGIGGAKYDAMTNQICREFFGIAAPEFATASATVHLPLSSPFPVSETGLREVLRTIRDCKYNPDRQIPSTTHGAAPTLITEKQQLLARIIGRRPTILEHRELEQLNQKLSPFVQIRRQNLLADSEMLQRQLTANSIFQDREFSWCLHPTATIRSFMEREFL